MAVELMRVPMIAFNVMLCSGRALNLVYGQPKQRLFIQDDPIPEKKPDSCAMRVLPSAVHQRIMKTVLLL